MENAAKMYLNLIDIANKIIGYVLAAVLGVMSVVIFAQVISRNLFGSSIPWSEELARFLMVFLVMFGAVVALRQGNLIAVDIIHERVGGTPGKVIKILTHITSMIFYAVILVFGWEFAQAASNQFAPATELSMFYVYLSLPLAALFLLLNSIAGILDIVFDTGE